MKTKLIREWGCYDGAVATGAYASKSVEFAGKVWTPNRKLVYVTGILCHALPNVNSKRRAFTAETLANSFESIAHQMCDYEHRLEFYGADKDEIVGTVVAAQYPQKTEAVASAKGGKAPAMEILIALWRKAAGVEKAIEEIADGDKAWKLSMECEWPGEESALWDGEKFWPWAECSDDMKALVKQYTVGEWGGKPMALIMGGQDGEVLFTGAGLTKRPADKDAKLMQVAASERPSIAVSVGWNWEEDWRQAVAGSQETAAKAWDTEDAPDKFFAYVPPEAKGPNGKKSLRKFPLASVERKGLDPAILRNALARFSQAKLPAGAKAGVMAKIRAAVESWNRAHPQERIVMEKASLIVGKTDPCEDDGHDHQIASDLSVLPTGGHGHYTRLIEFDGVTLSGLTGAAYTSKPDGKMGEHLHMFSLRACRKCDDEKKEKGSGGMKEHIKFLREQAALLKEAAPETAKALLDEAARLEKEDETAGVESTIAARIASGDLIPKAKHAEVVAAAEKVARDAVEKANAEKAAAEKWASDLKAARTAAIATAKLDPKFTLGQDRTIESVAMAMPIPKQGEKDAEFETWLGDLRAMMEKTGQARAAQEKANAGNEDVTPPMGGGADGTKAKKLLI